MKKSQIAIALGAFTLAIGGFFASKASKFAGVTAGTFVGSSSANGVNASNMSASHFTTVSANGKLVYISTTGGTKLATLRTGTSAITKAVYYH